MLNYDLVRAENLYRLELLHREWRPVLARRAARARARNEIDAARQRRAERPGLES